MKLLCAKNDLEQKAKSITIKEIEKDLNEDGQKIFYFDQSNSHKDLVALVDHFEGKGSSVYLKEVKYALDENDYIYEVHIL